MNDEDCYHIDELDNENTKDQQNENHIFTRVFCTPIKLSVYPKVAKNTYTK